MAGAAIARMAQPADMADRTPIEQRYFDQLRQRALEVDRARRSRESEGSTEWTDLDQYGFDGRWDGMTLAEAMQATGSNGERLVDN